MHDDHDADATLAPDPSRMELDMEIDAITAASGRTQYTIAAPAR
jgi:hypothetical protein